MSTSKSDISIGMDIGKIVKKRREIFDVRDPLYCVWLQEMAMRGFIIEKTGFFRDSFRIEKPEKRLYRIVDKAYNGMTDEEKGLYEEAGWEKVDSTFGDVTLLTNRDVNATEIYSDRDSYAKSIRGKWIGSLLAIAACFFWIFRSGSALAELLGGGDYVKKYGYWHGLDGEPLILDFILLIVGSLTIAYFVIQTINLFKQMKSDYSKEMPRYDIAYNDHKYIKAKRMRQVSDCFVVLILMCLVSAWIGYTIYEYDAIESGADALSYSGEHPVMLREVSHSDWNGIQPLINDNDLYNAEEGETYYSVDYMAGDESGGIFRESCREQVQKDKVTVGVDNDDYQMELFYMSEYKVARNEKIAEEYLAEEIAYDLYGKVEKDALNKAIDTAKIDLDGVDYAAYIEKDKYEVPTVILPGEDESIYDAESGTELVKFPNGGKQQNLYLRKGETIEIVQYFGPENLRDKMSIFVKELN